ncbi:MAG: SdpI family protein [Erysipelotrichaceae bacterium]
MKNKSFKINLFIIGLICVITTTGLVTLPDTVPTHFNELGVADSYSSKNSIIAFPVIAILFSIVSRIIANNDPKLKENVNYANVLGIVNIVFNCIMLMTCLGVIMYTTNPGMINMSILCCLVLCSLLILLGNVMPKIKSNLYLGIRTPWTLASESNWERTHRFGGRVWLIGGLLIFPICFLETPINVYSSLAIFTICAIIPIIYSYYDFKKDINFEKEN